MDSMDISTHDEAALPGAASVEESRLFHAIGRRYQAALPDGVSRMQFRLGEDSAGTPAVWIVFIAHDDANPSAERIASIRRVADDVRSEVLKSGNERWPYVTIDVE